MHFSEAWLNLLDYFSMGGIIMLPLMALSVLMWLLIAERAIVLRRLARHNLSNHEMGEHLAQGRPPEGGGIVNLLVRRFMEQRCGRLDLDRAIADEVLLSLHRSLDRSLPMIGALATIAPLLGLLGTVTGMMSTFEVMSLFGTGNARGMAAGISEALITTETGLVVAIPGLYMKHFLEGRVRALRHRLAAAGGALRRRLQEVPC